MQVSAQSWRSPVGARQRPQSSEPLAQPALTADRDGHYPGNPQREDRAATTERRNERTGHKIVFVARALSSTLTELQIASKAPDAGHRFAPATAAPTEPPAATTLDELLSTFLSAA